MCREEENKGNFKKWKKIEMKCDYIEYVVVYV